MRANGNCNRVLAAVGVFAYALAAQPALAQDSAQVNATGELVEAPETFSIVGAQPLDFGAISLPEWSGVEAVCRYDLDTIQADGAATFWSLDPNGNGNAYDAGEVTPSGCYIAGTGSPARFDFSCESQNVTFSFSTTDAAARPEWNSELRAWAFLPGDPFTPYHIVKDGVSVTTSADVTTEDGPWGVDCGLEGAGSYVLYAGANVIIRTTADTSAVALGTVDLGTLTVNAAY